jgi:hypothetical protein
MYIGTRTRGIARPACDLLVLESHVISLFVAHPVRCCGGEAEPSPDVAPHAVLRCCRHEDAAQGPRGALSQRFRRGLESGLAGQGRNHTVKAEQQGSRVLHSRRQPDVLRAGRQGRPAAHRLRALAVPAAAQRTVHLFRSQPQGTQARAWSG